MNKDDRNEMIIDEFINKVLEIEKESQNDVENTSTIKINEKIEKAFEEVYKKYEDQ